MRCVHLLELVECNVRLLELVGCNVRLLELVGCNVHLLELVCSFVRTCLLKWGRYELSVGWN